jgi:uncharacterized membrane protein YccC
MNTTALLRPSTLLAIPLASWAFATRIWIAIVVALYAAFWLQLEAPSSAAVCVAVLAVPTRGQALEKAAFRLLATAIGVAASFALVGAFSQERDLLLLAFAAWMGVCVYVASLSDGNRAYAAVLSGYTVAIVAIQQMDTPQHVFETGISRGSAIAVGIASIAIVNDLLTAPDRHTALTAELASIHRRVRDYALAMMRGEVLDAGPSASLLREITLLRPDLKSLVTESSVGGNRSASARTTAVALVAQVHAARALATRPADEDTRQFQRRDQEVREGLADLKSGRRPARTWRTPYFRSHRAAAWAGARAAVWLLLTSIAFILTGWPSTNVALSFVAVFIGLGAISPNLRSFVVLALIAGPIAAAMAGVLEFLVLDGVTEFPLLALALAPFVIGATILMTLRNPMLSALGRLNLIFILLVFGPSNPQNYNSEDYLVTSLFVCLAAGLLLVAQTLVPPVTNEQRRRWLITSARREFDHLSSSSEVRRLAPEEEMFRDAVRIGQIVGLQAAGAQRGAVLDEALELFDRAGTQRLHQAGMTGDAT